MKDTTENTIQRTLRIRAGRPQVFRALMDPGNLSRWLFAAVDMRPEEGGAFSFEWRDSPSPATAQGEIRELIPDRRLALSWFMQADGVTSMATFALEDEPDGGTRLRFTHSGLPQEPEWAPRFEAVALEWDKVLLNLRFLLEERGEGKHLFFFRHQAVLHAACQRAFRAWTSPGGVAAWLASEVFVMAEEEGEISGVTLDTGKALYAEVQRIEPDRHLRFLWSEGGVRGLLGVSFWPTADGTEVTLTLRSFALLELERQFIQDLWERRLQRLEEFLTRRPLERAPTRDREFTITRTIEATPSRVWNAWTDAALLRRWLVNWTDLEPRVGGTFTLLWDHGGEVMGRVLEVKPGELLRLSWDIGALQTPTEVAIRLFPEAEPGVCRIEVRHGGWDAGPAWDAQREGHEGGWMEVLALLDVFLRQGAGRQRREAHLRRRLPLPKEGAVPLFATAQGLQSWVATRAELEPRVGGRFHMEMPGGVPLEGRVVVFSGAGEQGSVELESPHPAYFSWNLADSDDGTRAEVTLTTWSATPSWLESERSRWAAALDSLAGRDPAGLRGLTRELPEGEEPRTKP